MRRALLCLLAAGVGCSEAPREQLARLEVSPSPGADLVVISFDALRADAVAGSGPFQAAPPAFAKLAAESIRFDDAMAAAGSTPTAFAALWSGRWPHHAFRGWRFDAEPTLAQVLGEAGYRTALFANNAQLVPVRRFDRGFDTYVVDSTEADSTSRERDTMLLERALDWLDEPGSRHPSFVWIHLLDPHAPYDRRTETTELSARNGSSPVERFRDSSGPRFVAQNDAEYAWLRTLYADEVGLAGAHLTRLQERLASRPRADATLLVVTSDHGEEFGEHGGTQHGTVHAEVTRIPLFLRLPDRSGAGSRVLLPVSQVDLFPTLARLVGVAPPAGLDGIDWLLGAPRDRPRIALAMTSERRLAAAVSDSRHDLILTCGEGWSEGRLHDRADDPQQLRDLAQERPGEYLSLARRLGELLGEDPCRELAAASAGAPRQAVDSAAPAEVAGLASEEMRALAALGYLGSGAPPPPRLWFEPDPLPACEPGGLGVVTVRWSGAPGAVAIEVGSEGKLFATGDSSGSATTGPWASERTVFVLRELESQRWLVARAPGVVRCDHRGSSP